MELNSTIQVFFEPLLSTTQSLMGFMKVIFGGLIGLYVIMIILRWHEYRSLKKLFAEMKKELTRLQESIDRIDKGNKIKEEE